VYLIKKDMDKRFITLEEAISLLNEGNEIHTFRNGGGMLIGADHERESLLKRMEKYQTTLQIGGEMCRKLKHGVILEDESGYLFIEANEEKLNVFDPIKL